MGAKLLSFPERAPFSRCTLLRIHRLGSTAARRADDIVLQHDRALSRADIADLLELLTPRFVLQEARKFPSIQTFKVSVGADFGGMVMVAQH